MPNCPYLHRSAWSFWRILICDRCRCNSYELVIYSFWEGPQWVNISFMLQNLSEKQHPRSKILAYIALERVKACSTSLSSRQLLYSSSPRCRPASLFSSLWSPSRSWATMAATITMQLAIHIMAVIQGWLQFYDISHKMDLHMMLRLTWQYKCLV